MSSPMKLISDPSQNRGPALMGIAISITSLAMITVATRLWVRATMVGKVGWDDWAICLTALISIVGMGEVIAQVQHGAGRHNGDIPTQELRMGLMINYMSQLTYVYGICFCKLAVGASLLRIASTKFWKRLVLIVMVFVFAYTTAGFVTLLVQCTDIRILWDVSTKATCWPPSILLALSYTNFSLNIITDLIFAVFIPVPMLWNINVNRRTRISLFCVLGLGCFACVCAIIRITYLSTYGKYGDWLWDSQYLTMWSVLEMNVGIIAASLPSLRPLFSKFLGSIYGAGTKAKAYYAGGSLSRSKMNWQNLSGRHNDMRHSNYARPMGIEEPFHDASSQNALYGPNGEPTTNESLELVACAPMRDSGKLSKNPSVSTRVESKRSFEDEYTTPIEVPAKGITKTTSMTVTYQIQEARFA